VVNWGHKVAWIVALRVGVVLGSSIGGFPHSIRTFSRLEQLRLG